MTRQPPHDPVIRELVGMARQAQVSRRAALGGLGMGATALALAACSSGGGEKPSAANDRSSSDKSLTWANWAAYIDEDDSGDYPTLMAFEQQTGIQVTYDVAVDDNNTYYGKVKDQLALGQDIGADLVCLTDWMVNRMIRLGYTQELDKSEHPERGQSRTVVSPTRASTRAAPTRSRGRADSPASAGTRRRCRAVLTSVSDLWDPALKGRVGVLSEMRDTIGLLMLENGVDISGDFGSDEFLAAVQEFEKQVQRRADPQHQGQRVSRGSQERGHPRRDLLVG